MSTERWQAPLIIAFAVYLAGYAIGCFLEFATVSYAFGVPKLSVVETRAILGPWQPAIGGFRTRSLQLDKAIVSAKTIETEELSTGKRALRSYAMQTWLRPVPTFGYFLLWLIPVMAPMAGLLYGASRLLSLVNRVQSGFEVVGWPPAEGDGVVAMTMALSTALAHREAIESGGSGLCPACHYDLRASPDRCPECGTPVK